MITSHLYTTMSSPLGEIVLTSNGEAITGLYTPEHHYYIQAQKETHDPKPFQQGIKQLNEYFAGKRNKFDLPLAPVGTEFQKRVWKALNDIGYGETKSYGEIAKSLNHPNASRAVGMANSKNPICIIIPCHRVIGMNGKLTGYAGGIQAKEWLLNHEATVGSTKG
ncbi:methylated-DNA--[protein]-cysteine S-methyltransferase [Rickettsiales endosymbiont of Stachyamoeba lipophora]|uniref:methylated-DNA--[protein]-cysteine S-methyltransferase n=1 Tax=Rickettsiales endosymbiont of Stachyamoeba lipophora TaxID=2486578 RepID=UPI000F6521C8|nr:methylated-DNA--[protein]-cysteine S-methyltransferase [Rickettsiales endosymbiont of Stachyamoeba lipophora]AZL16081.1 methylated-DNA--[protein]-cysteine S-methyltransferase [Rickettsiales endosymbiont of Stachyamoeba lipophora]